MDLPRPPPSDRASLGQPRVLELLSCSLVLLRFPTLFEGLSAGSEVFIPTDCFCIQSFTNASLWPRIFHFSLGVRDHFISIPGRRAFGNRLYGFEDIEVDVARTAVG